MSCCHTLPRSVFEEQDRINELRQLRLDMAWIGTQSRFAGRLEWWYFICDELNHPYLRED